MGAQGSPAAKPTGPYPADLTLVESRRVIGYRLGKDADGADVQSLLDLGMGQNLHWFPEDVPPARLGSILAGMANATGGLVLLGVAPRTREVHGISQPAETIDQVFQAALLADPPLVLPIPVLLPYRGKQVMQVIVPHGLPNLYSVDGRYWVREGAQTNPLAARRMRQLLMERGAVHFESRPLPGATLNDLNPLQVAAYLDKLGLPTNEPWEQVLLRRGCLVRQDDKLCPTNAAILLFGRFPQQWLPSASILAARFPGQAFGDEFLKQDLTGCLPDQLRQAEAFLQQNLRSVVRMVGLERQEAPEYPYQAVRELLVNAVAHRDYNLQGDTIHLHIFSDHLEIHSPGGLPGPVNLNNLLDARFARNAVITQVLSDLGFVERLGYGLDRVVSSMRQQLLRPPRFEELGGAFRVTLFNDLPAASTLSAPDMPSGTFNPRQQAALVYLSSKNRITSRDFQELCPDVHSETLRRDLVDLVSQGVLIKVGDKRSTYYILKKTGASRRSDI